MENKKNNDLMEEKLKQIGLNLKKIPSILKDYEPLEFRPVKTYDEIQYKQYRFVPIKEIQILLSPTNRLDELDDKYKNARPIIDYLDDKNEENIIRYTTFLDMLKHLNLKEMEEIEEEQKALYIKTPFKVKYERNYLWQIYYSENTDKYFMLVPTKDADYSTFFYLLKKQLTTKKGGKIFVPIRNVDYTNNFLRKSEFQDVQNYLWLFTKDWALIYEVFDKDDNMTIQVVGETVVYDNIKSPYKIKISSKEEAQKFLKLLKALFILQTELPHYFNFITNIKRTQGLEFYFENEKIEYEILPEFINNEFDKLLQKIEMVENSIEKYKKMLKEYKEESENLEAEYFSKERQISTFLECKKSFFGKVKYYFKYSKKNKIQQVKIDKKEMFEEDIDENILIENKEKKKKNYTLEELIEKYKGYEIQENEMKNMLMDINALKLKNKNMKKKIENASMYIQEIDSHKKSIFDFWKYSNKDEVKTLEEGETEEYGITKKITKVFDYEEDLEKFGEELDKIQRNDLSKEDTDSVFITTTSELEILNKIKNNNVLPKDVEKSLKEIKQQAKDEKLLTKNDEFDIFGGMVDDSTKIKRIANKKHRELPKDKFKILDINKNSKQVGYKLTLTRVVNNIKDALKKVSLPDDLPVYKAVAGDKIEKNDINLFNIDLKNEIKNIVKTEETKINLYKINLTKGTNAIGCTNIIYYDNQNKTLPVGMNLDTRILVDISKLQLELKSKQSFKINVFENQQDDFSNANIKYVNVYEYDIK